MSFLNDTLTDTNGVLLENHTGETGATWTRHPSYIGTSPVIASNRLRETDAANASALYSSGVPSSAEYTIIWTVRRVAGSVQSFSSVCGRMSTTADTFYNVQYRHDVQEWRMFQNVANSFTLLGSFAQALTIGQDYACRFEITNATKKFLVDSVERISSADNTITDAGRVGVRMIGSSIDAEGYHYDSLATIGVDPVVVTSQIQIPAAQVTVPIVRGAVMDTPWIREQQTTVPFVRGVQVGDN